ncbi:MAG: oligopeptide transporter, OPT family [bacterium]|nr:oligopeptide transporter, OPT family [bacterium]
MEKRPFKPYVAEESNLAELTIKAMVLGIVMAIVLGTANAYLGMRAGLTVSAIFPAAVVAMAAMRLLGGTILEENIARTTASVGEALVAGAIFTLPAFIIAGVWDNLKYAESTAIMLVGGTLGVLFIIVLRRTMVEDTSLPFPESVAAAEIVKAGQGGQTGASTLFKAMGFAAVWEVLKNGFGIPVVRDSVSGFVKFGSSRIEIAGRGFDYSGGILLQTPSASPALVGVGYIVGMRVSTVLFAGAAFGWWVLVPLSVFLNPELAGLAQAQGWETVSGDVWRRQVRPLAVGTMIVAAFYTLYGLRMSLIGGITRAIRDLDTSKGSGTRLGRLATDLDFKKVFVAIGIVAVPMLVLYFIFSGSFLGAILLTIVMLILGFLFAAVAGYLVGLIGSSNNPISGLTLSALIIASIIMVAIGVTGPKGVMAVLGVAGVICCAAGIAGDMMQDLKVGYILGGSPRKMEIAEIIGVVFTALVLAFAIMALHKVYTIGSDLLPAPQAGLMALMAQGIVGGGMAWSLVIVGMLLGVALILTGSLSPMLIAVGMYLPFTATAPIFVGGIIRWFMDRALARKNLDETNRTKAENVGVLLSSGFIAGESLMAVIVAFFVLGHSLIDKSWEAAPLINVTPGPLGSWLGLMVFVLLGFLLIRLPLRAAGRKDD